MDINYLIEVKNLEKKFGYFAAVDDVSISVKEKETIGIIGSNGAGKTTLVNLLTGQLKPDKGTVLFKGEDITHYNVEKRVACGIVRTFQLLHVFNNISLYENIALSALRKKENSDFPKKICFLNLKNNSDINKKVNETIEIFNLQKIKDKIVSELPFGVQRKIEIAMAWITEPQLFILDEPFAGINDYEIDEIIEILKMLVDKKTIIIIEHKISKLKKIVDKLFVMHEGKIICEGSCDEVLDHPSVRKSYWKMDWKMDSQKTTEIDT